MCEIFALSAKRPIEPDAYLEEFFADSAWNPHGWGLVWYGDQGRELFKEPVQAVESGLLKYVLSWDLCSKLLIAHIRNATRGTLAYEDGEYLYIHTNTFQPTLYENVLDDGVVFCSRPIGTEDLWSPVPSCRLLAFRDGKMVEAAPDHGHGFDNDRYLKLIAEGKI